MQTNIPMNAPVPVRRKAGVRERKALFYGLLFTAPAVIGFILFTAGPMIASFVLSLTDYNVFKESVSFIGFDNYARLFSGQDESFYRSLGVTFYSSCCGCQPASSFPSLSPCC
ncbi:carbohydrate ABC transporter permease [Paenibacillus sp. AR247]|uniref:carbohydrate ABC transporter permease n=1 Tax=Paenibacillus sp. AR247 TaxID=1631599 RepID=UPI002157DE7F|nr:hypothetical protein [Paenibacillus sp. AR247]